MNNSIDIRPSDLNIVQSILQRTLTKDAKVWVFGSRAKGTATRSSDLDLAIDSGRALDREESSALFHAFEESDLPYKVDVVDLYAVNKTFKIIIEQQRIALPTQ